MTEVDVKPLMELETASHALDSAPSASSEPSPDPLTAPSSAASPDSAPSDHAPSDAAQSEEPQDEAAQSEQPAEAEQPANEDVDMEEEPVVAAPAKQRKSAISEDGIPAFHRFALIEFNQPVCLDKFFARFVSFFVIFDFRKSENGEISK